MATAIKERSDQRKSALTAGISLLIMTLASFFSYGYVHGSLVVPGDAGANRHRERRPPIRNLPGKLTNIRMPCLLYGD